MLSNLCLPICRGLVRNGDKKKFLTSVLMAWEGGQTKVQNMNLVLSDEFGMISVISVVVNIHGIISALVVNILL